MFNNLKGAVDVEYTEVVNKPKKKKMSQKKRFLIELVLFILVAIHMLMVVNNSFIHSKMEEQEKTILIYEKMATELSRQKELIEYQEKITNIVLKPEAESPKKNSRGVEVMKETIKEVESNQRKSIAENLNAKAGGKLKGYGDYIVEKSLEGDIKIDPNLVLSIAQHETTNGTSRAIRELNNPGGLMHPKRGGR